MTSHTNHHESNWTIAKRGVLAMAACDTQDQPESHDLHLEYATDAMPLIGDRTKRVCERVVDIQWSAKSGHGHWTR